MTGDAVWRWRIVRSASLPPLAWVATIEPPLVTVQCGLSVSVTDHAIFEGTWADDAPLRSAAGATTVFGSGIVADGERLVAIGPSHPLESIYVTRRPRQAVVSNSLVGLLVRAGLEPDPTVLYPQIFGRVADLKWLTQADDQTGLAGARLALPMVNGDVEAVFYENLAITTTLEFALVPKRREPPFVSFDDYARRLHAAAAALVANAPTYKPVVALSGGYDSTAVAAVMVRVGCRESFGFDRSRVMRTGGVLEDSGAQTAKRLGMTYQSFDSESYRQRTDLPEAEFMSAGMTGEDIFMSGLEPRLNRRLLVTGHWGGRTWDLSVGEHVKSPHPGDVSGCSLGEFRLRTDFIHVPLPFFGAAPAADSRSFVWDADMRPYHVGGNYDRPIARRLAEEAGIPRGTFARSKAAVGVLFQRDGRAAFSTAALGAIEAFARDEGRTFEFARRTPIGRRHRALVKLAHALHLGRWARGLERRRLEMTHFEPVGGAVVFRWAVAVVRARYEELAP